LAGRRPQAESNYGVVLTIRNFTGGKANELEQKTDTLGSQSETMRDMVTQIEKLSISGTFHSR